MRVQTSLREIMAALEARKNPKNVAGMARFGIHASKAFGVSLGDLRRLARGVARDNALADQLWATGVHEARMMAALVADPATLSASTMERWVRDFDSWDLCDTCCGSCFDRHPRAWEKAVAWARRKPEFVRRAGFAMMAWLAVHDKRAEDAKFEALLPLIEQHAVDERNYVRKAVNWALRQIGKRNERLRRKAIAAARRIRKFESKSARWIAADALRELTSTSR